jgi:signal transduction histidine kinase
VSVRAHAEGTNLVVAVQDDGAGIPETDLERVFELYYTTKDRGSGIGLSLSQRLVAQHGGRIEITSQVGAGTTVRIHLPRSGPAGVGAAPARSEST